MAAIYEYTGVVEKVLQLQTFASGFTKRDVVMTDDVGTESKWPNHIAFTFKKDPQDRGPQRRRLLDRASPRPRRARFPR